MPRRARERMLVAGVCSGRGLNSTSRGTTCLIPEWGQEYDRGGRPQGSPYPKQASKQEYSGEHIFRTPKGAKLTNRRAPRGRSPGQGSVEVPDKQASRQQASRQQASKQAGMAGRQESAFVLSSAAAPKGAWLQLECRKSCLDPRVRMCAWDWGFPPLP